MGTVLSYAWRAAHRLRFSVTTPRVDGAPVCTSVTAARQPPPGPQRSAAPHGSSSRAGAECDAGDQCYQGGAVAVRLCAPATLATPWLFRQEMPALRVLSVALCLALLAPATGDAKPR